MRERTERKDSVTVNVPAELPEPTRRGWRILLAILVEVTLDDLWGTRGIHRSG